MSRQDPTTNGVGKYGKKGAKVTWSFSQETMVSEFVVIGDKWCPSEEGADSVAVYVGDTKNGTFSPDLSETPSYGDKLHRRALFYAHDYDTGRASTISLVIESGDVRLTGLSFLENEFNAAVLQEISGQSASEQATSITALSAGIVMIVVVITASVAGIVIILRTHRNARPSDDVIDVLV